VKLLLYTDYLDLDDFYYCSMKTGLSFQNIADTKCGSTISAIEYLLSFKNPLDYEHFDINKAYSIELQSINEYGLPTEPSHSFILLYYHEWILLDSYIGQRQFTCRVVDIVEISAIISSLQQHSDSNLWEQLTGIREEAPKNLIVGIYQYDWDPFQIEAQYQKLVKSARDRFEIAINYHNNPLRVGLAETKDWFGLSDEHLAVLNPNLDVIEARAYLDSL